MGLGVFLVHTYLRKGFVTAEERTGVGGGILGKMRPHLGTIRPIWANCTKSGQTCSRIGQKKFNHPEFWRHLGQDKKLLSTQTWLPCWQSNLKFRENVKRNLIEFPAGYSCLSGAHSECSQWMALSANQRKQWSTEHGPLRSHLHYPSPRPSPSQSKVNHWQARHCFRFQDKPPLQLEVPGNICCVDFCYYPLLPIITYYSSFFPAVMM